MLFSTRMAAEQTDFQRTFPIRKPSGGGETQQSEYYGVPLALWPNRWANVRANIQCLPKQLQISWTWIIEQVRMESVLVVKCYWWNSGLVWWIFNMFQSGDNFSRDSPATEPGSRSRRWSPRRQLRQVAAHLALCVSQKLQRLQTQLWDFPLCAEILQEARGQTDRTATTWCSQDQGRGYGDMFVKWWWSMLTLLLQVTALCPPWPAWVTSPLSPSSPRRKPTLRSRSCGRSWGRSTTRSSVFRASYRLM